MHAFLFTILGEYTEYLRSGQSFVPTIFVSPPNIDITHEVLVNIINNTIEQVQGSKVFF